SDRIFLHCRIFAPILPQRNKSSCANVKQIRTAPSGRASGRVIPPCPALRARRKSPATSFSRLTRRGAAEPLCPACVRLHQRSSESRPPVRLPSRVGVFRGSEGAAQSRRGPRGREACPPAHRV